MNREEYILPDNIKSILSKYYDGLTSIEEEKLLKKYFVDYQIPESLLADQAILSFGSPEEVTLYPNNELWDLIKQNELKQNKFRKTIRLVSSIAASLLIILSLGIGYYLTSAKQDLMATDTYSNPEDAYKAVQKYLGFASSKLSIAYTEIKPIEKLAIPSKAISSFSDIDKNLERLKGFEKLNSSTQELKRFSILNDIIRVDNNN